MAEENGFELIQGKGNQVRFTGICPECKTFDEKLKSAWVENNSFWEQIQCPVCGYDKVVSEIKLVEDALSGIDADIAIKMKLFELAQEVFSSVCKKCGYTDLIPNEDMRLPAFCPNCGSKDMDVSQKEGNTAVLIWLGKHVLHKSDD